MSRNIFTATALASGVFAATVSTFASDNPRLDFWSQQRKGANQFNHVSNDDWFAAAGAIGLEFVRLVPDKWTASQRDFLIGNCDHFTGLDPRDLNRLLAALDQAHAHGVKIVLGMLSLPGCRWGQLNGGQEDNRLWQDESFQQQAEAFWRELAARLRDHPAIVAYNPLNEPHPERGDGIKDVSDPRFVTWLEQHRGTTADLDRFNRRIVAAIRSVDPLTPVLVEGYGYGSVRGLSHLEPLDDPAVLYSLHFYEPWQFTTRHVNNGRYAYPERMATEWEAPGTAWSRENLAALMQPAADWAQRHHIDRRRIVAAEFGCSRRVGGAQRYLTDVVSLLNEHDWHWAFYAFREDGWDEMDYELGTAVVPEGRSAADARKRNPLFEVIQRELPRRRD